jgi:hypothetical protein
MSRDSSGRLDDATPGFDYPHLNRDPCARHDDQGIRSAMKTFLMILGFLAAALILTQVTMGQLILSSHSPKLIKAHQHSGYLTVVVSLVYIALSLLAIASLPRREKP